MSKKVRVSQVIAQAALTVFRTEAGSTGLTFELFADQVGHGHTSRRMATPFDAESPAFDAVSDNTTSAKFAAVTGLDPVDATITDLDPNDNIVRSFQWSQTGAIGTCGTSGTDIVLSQAALENGDDVTLTAFTILYPE